LSAALAAMSWRKLAAMSSAAAYNGGWRRQSMRRQLINGG